MPQRLSLSLSDDSEKVSGLWAMDQGPGTGLVGLKSTLWRCSVQVEGKRAGDRVAPFLLQEGSPLGLGGPGFSE